jgi:endonuclease YncB( thermonuclease family)
VDGSGLPSQNFTLRRAIEDWAMTLAWRAIFLGFLFELRTAVPLSAQNSMIGIASIIDGDTVEIHGQRIRFHGIDAPESSQLCTPSVRRALALWPAGGARPGRSDRA